MNEKKYTARLILDRPEFHVWLDEVIRPDEWESPCATEEFALLVYAEPNVLGEEEMNHLCRRFVATGCRYALCVGDNANIWERAFDDAYLFPTGFFDPDYVPPENKFLMTTVHQEPLSDVVEFLFNAARMSNWVPKCYLLVIVGKNEQIRRQLISAVWSQLGDDDQYQVKKLLREILNKVQK